MADAAEPVIEDTNNYTGRTTAIWLSYCIKALKGFVEAVKTGDRVKMLHAVTATGQLGLSMSVWFTNAACNLCMNEQEALEARKIAETLANEIADKLDGEADKALKGRSQELLLKETPVPAVNGTSDGTVN